MKLTLNGETYETETACTVEDLVRSLELHGKRVAVMVNEDVVKRTRWSDWNLANGDSVEVIHMVGGG